MTLNGSERLVKSNRFCAEVNPTHRITCVNSSALVNPWNWEIESFPACGAHPCPPNLEQAPDPQIHEVHELYHAPLVIWGVLNADCCPHCKVHPKKTNPCPETLRMPSTRPQISSDVIIVDAAVLPTGATLGRVLNLALPLVSNIGNVQDIGNLRSRT